LLAAGLAAAAANIIGRLFMAVFSPSFFDVVPMASFFFLCGVMFTTLQRLGLKPGWVLRQAVVSRKFDSGREIRPAFPDALPSPNPGGA
jgi:hypothetical protein